MFHVKHFKNQINYPLRYFRPIFMAILCNANIKRSNLYNFTHKWMKNLGRIVEVQSTGQYVGIIKKKIINTKYVLQK